MRCFAVCAFHAAIKLINGFGEFSRYTIRRSGLRFCPIKRDSEAGATSTASEAGIILAHVSVFELFVNEYVYAFNVYEFVPGIN